MSRGPRGRVPRPGPASLVVALLAALALSSGAAAAGPPRPQAAKPAGGRPASVAVSYADLVDPDAMVRDGRRLGAALRDPITPRSLLQPFLDGYSSLLPYVVEMVFGADPVPRRDILERWPAGSAQPAWVAVFRGGKYRAVADHEGRVRLFLPGDDAAAAWRSHYGVVRHALAALAAGGSVPLTVEVFAYRNDYRKQELRLALRPVTVAGSAFPPARAPLDLTALEDFFRQGGQLEGAQLDRDEGLVLFANPDRRDTLGGEPLSLADLAVAYRAAFHAGDNDAFISLDPNPDPALATVNFGGFLEDTRVGAAVLAADRRFKTICSGLDPVTHQDVRREARKVVPTFLTNSERAFLVAGEAGRQGWVMTRYWFYPESVSVDADPVEGFAVITRPRFTADAERIGKGFENAGSKKKRAALDPGIRQNIKDINANHARYAEAFPEIGDLAAVARLMAVSTWLKRSDTSWLDLDALLAVELPAVSTPRTLERIISTEYLAVPPGGKVTDTMVRESSEVTWMTPMLQRTVGDFFGSARSYTGYLCAARKGERRPCSSYEAEAARLFEEQRDQPLRSLFSGDEALMVFLEYLVNKIVYPLPPEGEAARAERIADGKRLERLQQEMARVTREIEAAGEPAPEDLLRERTRLDDDITAIMKRYHEAGDDGKEWRTTSRIQVSGGISLNPQEFTIRKNPGSPALQKFKRLAQGAAVTAGKAGGGARLVRSRPSGKAPRVAAAAKPAPTQKPPAPASAKSGAAARPAAPATPAPKATAARTAATPAPAKAPAAKALPPAAETPAPKAAPPAVVDAAPSRVPSLVATKISVPAGAAGAAQALGELGADGRIVFRKVSR